MAPGGGTPIGPLLETVFEVCIFFHNYGSLRLIIHLCGQSILEVFLLCLAGYILAWKGILDKATQKVCPVSFVPLVS